MRNRTTGLMLATLVCASCAEYCDPPPHSPQEAMARGEPIAPVDDAAAKAGDPGVVTGRLTVIETFAPASPVGFQTVTLYRDGAAVGQATTDARGAFMFVRVKGGDEYQVRVTSDRFEGSQRFFLKAGNPARIELVIRPLVQSQK